MNINDTVLVDLFDAGTLDEAAELSALVRALELAEGFSLIFVCCNQAPQRERLMKEVQSRLPNLNLQFINFRGPIDHLLDSLRERLTTPMPDAIFVSGLEYSLPVIAEAHTAPLIANLNASRNSFPQTLSCPLVFWAPEYVLTAIAQGAPDFFSIRSGVYFFASTPAEMAGLVHSLSLNNANEAANLPLAEKKSRIAALESLLSDYESLPHDQRDYQAELRLHFQLGNLLLLLGAYEMAMKHYERSLHLSERLGDRAVLANALLNIGNIQYFRGEYGAALEQYKQSLAIFEEIGDPTGVASLLNQIGVIHQERGEYEAALDQYQQSLAIKEQLSNRAGVASSLHNIGIVHQNRGKIAEALEYHQRSLAIAEELGDRSGIASSLHQIGNLYYLRGEYAQALEQYQQSLMIREQLGDLIGVASSLGQIGRLFIDTKQYAEAFPLLLNALAKFLELHSPYAGLAVDDLKKLRATWGSANFDAAWRKATNEDVPNWLTKELQAAAS